MSNAASYNNMEVNMIVAAGKDGAIGMKGDLIWRISADLRRFKSLTTGHPVIMGRKTWDSLPKKPLPGRRNIVVTRNPGFCAEGCEAVGSPGEALALTEGEEPFVIGGAEIYKSFFPYVSRIYLTEIDAACQDADARMVLPGDMPGWKEAEASEIEETAEGVRYRYVTYVRTGQRSL